MHLCRPSRKIKCNCMSHNISKFGTRLFWRLALLLVTYSEWSLVPE